MYREMNMLFWLAFALSAIGLIFLSYRNPYMGLMLTPLLAAVGISHLAYNIRREEEKSVLNAMRDLLKSMLAAIKSEKTHLMVSDKEKDEKLEDGEKRIIKKVLELENDLRKITKAYGQKIIELEEDVKKKLK